MTYQGSLGVGHVGELTVSSLGGVPPASPADTL